MSEYLLNLTNGATSASQSLWSVGSLLTNSGVLTATSLTVSAQTSPDMTVKVSGSTNSDKIIFITAGGDTYFGKITANKPITITSNSSGVTKTDAVVAYADTAAGDPANAGSPGALKFLVVRRSGTNTGNPTQAEIDAATGSKPSVLLAYATVTNGASSITASNLTDARVWTHLNFLTGVGVSNRPLLSFVPRYPASASWDYNAQAQPGTGYSIQATVGTTATRVRIRGVMLSTGDARVRAIFAKGGSGLGTTSRGDPRIYELSPVHGLSSTTSITDTLNGNYRYQEFDVDLSTTQTMDVTLDPYGQASSTYRLSFSVIGWWEPA